MINSALKHKSSSLWLSLCWKEGTDDIDCSRVVVEAFVAPCLNQSSQTLSQLANSDSVVYAVDLYDDINMTWNLSVRLCPPEQVLPIRLVWTCVHPQFTRLLFYTRVLFLKTRQQEKSKCQQRHSYWRNLPGTHFLTTLKNCIMSRKYWDFKPHSSVFCHISDRWYFPRVIS